MLSASEPAPNIEPQHAISVPTPGNWRGVSDGMHSAREAVRQLQFEQAEQILLEMLEFAPVEIKAWKLLARVQRQLGQIEAGIRSATRALQLQNNPLTDEPPASITLARLLWEQQEYSAARAMLRELINQDPENKTLQQFQQQWQTEEN